MGRRYIGFVGFSCSITLPLENIFAPPHKRQLKDGEASSSLTPELPPEHLIPRFRRNVDFTPRFNPCYADKAISKWFVVGLADESRVSDLARLEPVAKHDFELEPGETPLALVVKETGKEKNEFSANPWIFIVESVKQDLFSSFQQVKDEIRGDELGDLKPSPTLVVRFGRIHFHGKRWSTAESLRQLRKSFYTNIPPSYMEHITNSIVPEIGFEFEEEKERYYVEFARTMRSDSFFICKCYFAKDTNQLEPYKIEKSERIIERRLVEDMACLEKNLDLRLTLYTKRSSRFLTDELTENMKSLINSAILDSDVKGGLRWPLGKQSSGQWTVVKVWHTNAKTFKNSSMRLRTRLADRFDFRTSQGEVASEVILKMPGIWPLLQEPTGNTDAALEMLQENMKLIWMHFLS